MGSAHAEPVTRTVAPRLEERPSDGSATRVDLSEHERTPGDLAEATGQLPGAHVRRTGSGAMPAFLSVRGAAPNQVRVLLDGVPLHGGGASSFDLSAIPAGLLGGLTLHRSGAPLRLGAPLPGGALLLESPGSRTSRAAGRLTGGGRFEREALGAITLHGTRPSSPATDIRLSLTGDRGDFRYFDDGGTPFSDTDDRPDARRSNNDSMGAAWLVRHRRREAGWRLTALTLGAVRESGLAGPVGLQSRDARLAQLRLDQILQADRPRWPSAPVDTTLRVWSSATHDRLNDPSGEIGLTEQRVQQTGWRAGSAAEVTLHPAQWLAVETFAGHEHEALTSRDRDDTRFAHRTIRHAGGGGAELSAAVPGAWAEARVGARGDVARTVDDRSGVASTHPLFSPAGRLGARLAGHRGGIGLHAGLWSAERVPDFMELFGDRGWTQGNPELQPERRRNADLGLRGDLHGARGSLRGDLAFFEAEARHLIAWIQNSQGVRRPINLDRVRFRGWEATLDARHFRGHQLTLNGHLIDAVQRSGGPDSRGRRLPYVPDLAGSATARTRAGRSDLTWTAHAQAPFYLDTANTRALPARQQHDVSAGLRLGPDQRWSLAATIRNLFDQRIADAPLRDGGRTIPVPQPVSDTLGYPLPGRTLLLTLHHEARLP